MQKKQSVTDWRTDGLTHQPTNTVTYRSHARDKNVKISVMYTRLRT